MLFQKFVILTITFYNFFCPINSLQNKPNHNKRYLWKTIQKDIIPIAYCEGYLELNKNNIPYKSGISITIDYDMWKTTKWE